MRNYYPDAPNAWVAKSKFFKEHHCYAKHCFQNTWGTGYIIFDSKEDVNLWWKEHTGRYFYDAEYEQGTSFTESDAMNEIEDSYGKLIDEVLSSRDFSLSILAIGLPSSRAFGNRLFLKFCKSTEEEDITWRFYVHYYPICLNVLCSSNIEIRKKVIRILFNYFYLDRFKKRIEGSKKSN